MAVIRAFLLRHTAVVEPLTGEGGNGPTYGPPATVRCFRDDRRRLVRGRDGSEVVSETTLYMRPAEVCPVGSRVTLPGGRVCTVITSAERDGGGLPTPDHREVTLL